MSINTKILKTRIAHYALLLLLVIAISIVLANQSIASEVSVGGKKIKIVDSLARTANWFGRPALEIFFFLNPLTEVQKEKIALKQYPTDEDIETITAGNLPVFKLLLFFEEDTQVCSDDRLVSYTAVYKQNKSFDFGSPEKSYINWAFTRPSNSPLSKLGIERLSCSFAHGAMVNLRVKHHWLAERPKWNAVLPKGRSSLLFGWDIDVRAKVIDPSKVEHPTNTIVINNDMVKDTSVSWVARNNMLAIRFFRRTLTSDERTAAAGYPPKFPSDEFLGGIFAFYGRAVSSFSTSKPERAQIIIVEKKEIESFHQHDYPVDIGSLQISGAPKRSSKVTVRSEGRGMADPGQDKPSATWNLDISGIIEQVH